MATTAAELERLPPSNIDAEQAVLGSLLIDRQLLSKISSSLLPEDFFRHSHKFIYAAMLALDGRGVPADIVTLADELERNELLESAGGLSYIHSLATIVPTPIHLAYYAEIVRRTALKRKLIDVASRMAVIGYDDSMEVQDAFNESEKMLMELIQQRVVRDFVPIADVLSDYFENLDDLLKNAGQLRGLPSGFSKLDELLGGFQPTDLIVLAARPGIGKTAFILNIAAHVAEHAGKGVAIFNLEMSAEQLVQRMIACAAGVNLQHLRTGALPEWEYSRVVDAISRLSQLSVFFDESGEVSINELRSKARRIVAEQKVALIIVDYLQLMHGSANRSRDNRVQEVSEITRQLKQMARELGVPVIAVSQLSRAIESRSDQRPQLSDLRESGSIEQDADVVVFISRDRNSEDQRNHADVLVQKHRNGPTGDVALQFFGAYQQFADYPAGSAPTQPY